MQANEDQAESLIQKQSRPAQYLRNRTAEFGLSSGNVQNDICDTCLDLHSFPLLIQKDDGGDQMP